MYRPISRDGAIVAGGILSLESTPVEVVQHSESRPVTLLSTSVLLTSLCRAIHRSTDGNTAAVKASGGSNVSLGMLKDLLESGAKPARGRIAPIAKAVSSVKCQPQTVKEGLDIAIAHYIRLVPMPMSSQLLLQIHTGLSHH